MNNFSGRLRLLLLVTLLGGWSQLASATPDKPYDWLQFDGNAQHSGINEQETIITPENVDQLRVLFQVSLKNPGLPSPDDAETVDSAPVYLSAVTIQPGKTRDLLFVNTTNANLFALDAHTGMTVWSASHANPRCMNALGIPCITTATPAIDPDRQYIYSYGFDGKIHKHNVSDGTEIVTDGWPELVTAKPQLDKESSALSIATARSGVTYLYAVTAGFDDFGDYQGHVVAINLTTGQQHVFNALCSNLSAHLLRAPDEPLCKHHQAGIWSRPGVVYVPALDRIVFATGNGDFDPEAFAWGDSVLEISPDGTADLAGQPLDSYTPDGVGDYQLRDWDLGSTAPVLLPVQNGKNLAIQTGKDALIHIIDLDNLSGHHRAGLIGGALSIRAVPGSHTGNYFYQPIVWTDPATHQAWFIDATKQALFGLPLAASGSSLLVTGWVINDQHCSSPLVANNVLFCSGDRNVYAYNPATGALLWQDTSLKAAIHWQSVIVANGILYAPDGADWLTAFSLTPLPPSPNAGTPQ